MEQFIMSLDAGTTSNRCILFDRHGVPRAMAQREFTQFFPAPGQVEHDAEEIFDVMLSVARQALENANVPPEAIAAIGITNQRETTVVWNRHTGHPVCPAIVWQCRRTAPFCEKLQKAGYSETIRNKTGLIIDPYFSGTKIRWILDNIPHAREEAEKGNLLFGTIETWLIWKLTCGKVHVTDYSNASRTMLFNIHTLTWDPELLEILRIPASMLPVPVPSSCVFGDADPHYFGKAIPLSGAAGDQQAALFGQLCLEPGSCKCTYGTGAFLLMNTGTTPISSSSGLLTTIAWGLDGKVNYALEGSVFTAGAVIQWLRDEMHLIETAADSEYYASKVDDTNGCYVVPAFTGLGAPYWDAYARGAVVGLTRGVNKNHIIRAALDSIAYQVTDVLNAMVIDSGIPISILKVDGGASANNLLMQTQADISNIPVQRPSCVETTAAGAAYLAGLAVGYWAAPEDIRKNISVQMSFTSSIGSDKRTAKTAGWHKAVHSCLGWAKEDSGAEN